MRVLVVTPWYPSEAHGGSGIFNLRDVELLAQDHEVRVLHLIRPEWFGGVEPGDDGPVPVVRVPFAAARPTTWRGARTAIRHELRSAEMLHSMAFPALLPFLGMPVGVPWVHTEHWSGMARVHRGAKGVVDRMLRMRLRRPDEVVAVSTALAASIDASTRRPPHVIGNAVPFPPEGACSRPREASQPLRLLSIGGLVENKGPLLAMEAIAELMNRGVDARLRWVGDGPQRAEVEARIAELSLEDRVELLGQLDRPAVEAQLLAAHLFMLPTVGETFGVAIAEALACGLPVVTTGTGGHVEMLEAFRGAAITERSASALAEAVIHAMREDSGEIRLATASVARARFSDAARRDAYRSVYARAAGS